MCHVVNKYHRPLCYALYMHQIPRVCEVGGIIIIIIPVLRAQVLQLDHLDRSPNSAISWLGPWPTLLSHFVAPFSHPQGRTDYAHLTCLFCINSI